jgi:hypothetical protein
MFKNKSWPYLDHIRDKTNGDDHTPGFIQGDVAALVGPDTRTRDILVSMHHGDRTSDSADACYLGLVMREDHANMFRIIGQAFLHPGISPCYGTNGRPGCDYCVGGNEPSLGSLRLVFSILEWTLLMGSFLVPGLSTPIQQLNPAVSGLFSRSYAEMKKRSPDSANNGRGTKDLTVTEEVTIEQEPV